MVLNLADKRTGTEVQGVVSCLEEEKRLEEALARSRADTGDSLQRLESSCRQAGLNRSDWVSALRSETGRLGLAVLSETDIANRKRMATFRRCYPPAIADEFLLLSPARQKAFACLPFDRMEEFQYLGVPTPCGRKSLQTAKAQEVRRAVRASREVPPGEEMEDTLSFVPCTELKPTETQRFDEALCSLRQLGKLTLEQAGEILAMLVWLLARTPKEGSRTTRRLMESTLHLAAGLDEAVDVEEVFKTLDALPLVWQKVDLGPGVDPDDATNHACSLVSQLLETISLWTRRKAETE